MPGCILARLGGAIIPYTYEHTIFHTYRKGDKVNIEFDIIGKYVQRHLAAYREKG